MLCGKLEIQSRGGSFLLFSQIVLLNFSPVLLGGKWHPLHLPALCPFISSSKYNLSLLTSCGILAHSDFFHLALCVTYSPHLCHYATYTQHISLSLLNSTSLITLIACTHSWCCYPAVMLALQGG